MKLNAVDGQVLVFELTVWNTSVLVKQVQQCGQNMVLEKLYYSSEAVTEPEVVEEIVETVESEIETSKDPMLEIKTIETRLGTLTLESDYPTTETQRTLEDEVFYQRAVQVYSAFITCCKLAGIFDEFDEVGASHGDIIYWSDFMTSDTVVATANTLCVVLHCLFRFVRGSYSN